MNLITKILTILVALEFLYIMYIETIITTSEKTSKVFGIPTDILQDKTVSTLLKNQGIYNGLIGVLILIAVLVFASKVATISLLIYVILVATYGGITSNPKIILMQGTCHSCTNIHNLLDIKTCIRLFLIQVFFIELLCLELIHLLQQVRLSFLPYQLVTYPVIQYHG